MNVFVSGATGYIGGAICRTLAASGMTVFGGVRVHTTLPPGITPYQTGNLSKAANFELPPVDAVIHAAGLGHRSGGTVNEWRRENIDPAVNMAGAAQRAGAKKFILISSAYVNGRTHDGLLTEHLHPRPTDEYGASKLLAEQEAAKDFLAGPVTAIRPAAVIGPACPGNLRTLLALLRRGVPLPFAGLHNLRSFIDIEDLAALVLAVLQAPAPPPVLLAAHPIPISAPDLIRALATGMGVHARLFPLPAGLLAAAARLTGRAETWTSLSSNFIIDPKLAASFGWSPRQTLTDSLAEIGRYHNTTHTKA